MSDQGLTPREIAKLRAEIAELRRMLDALRLEVEEMSDERGVDLMTRATTARAVGDLVD
jgi:hypothetical protein